MRILYDSKNEKFKKPFGCLRQNEECTINLYIPQSCMTESAAIVFEGEKCGNKTVPMTKKSDVDAYEIWSAEFALDECDLYFYYFSLVTVQSSFNLFKEGYADTNIGEGGKWQLTCYAKDYDASCGFKGKVMYQIFPDRCAIGEAVDNCGKLEP